MTKICLLTLTAVSFVLLRVGKSVEGKSSVQVTPPEHVECRIGVCGHDEYCCGEQKCCKYQCTRLGHCLDDIEYCCGHNECCPHECDDVECRDNQFCCGKDKCCNFDEIYHQWWFWFSTALILTIVVGSMILFAYCERTKTTPHIFHLKKVTKSPSKGYAKLEEEF
ncbi:uncharacterized protein [Ptychodera flava]|uniref:uncharacterized protein n=1 Tax=Ptychodera flava TaxID=63121 RepID=UPI00396A409C